MSAPRKSCQAYRIQVGGGSVPVWGAFHSGAKSPLVFPDRYLSGELYSGILQNTLLLFARQHLGYNFCYQGNIATPHHAWVVLDFLQQGHITNMKQPARSPECNPIEHIWDELGHAISSMATTPHNPDELCQALLDKKAKIPLECLQCLGLLMQPISPKSINVITNLPKYTLKKIVIQYTEKQKSGLPACI